MAITHTGPREMTAEPVSTAVRSRAAVVVRSLAAHDVDAIHEILTSVEVIEGTMRVPYAPLDKTAARVAPRVGVSHLVAECEGRVTGMLELVTYPDEPRHRHVAEVNLLAVHPDWSGRGVGRTLLQAALDLCEDWLDIRRVSLVVFEDNMIAIDLYRQLGFVVEGTLRSYGRKRGRDIDALVMARVHPGPGQ